MRALVIFAAQILRLAAATVATVLQLVHRKRLMIREGIRRLGNRQEPAVVHVSLGLDNVGSDNLAWCVEIASDRLPNDRTADEIVRVKFSDHEEGPTRKHRLRRCSRMGVSIEIRHVNLQRRRVENDR